MSDPAWATESTKAILSLLDESDVALSKRGVEVNLALRGEDVSYSTVKEHLRLSEASGLVDVVEEKGAWYAINDKGRAFLAGELNMNDTASQEDGNRE